MMQSKLPKISIVTPSFNQVDFLEETILSVISQGYPNLEYIIIDGGSNDGSVEIIKKYQKYLSYWVSEKDNGQADALNKGFSKSTGEIMAWINSDDKYFEWTFNTVAEIFIKFKNIHWISGMPSVYDDKGRIYGSGDKCRNLYNYLLGDFYLQQESIFWRRNLWEKAGGEINIQLKFMVDTDLWCRFFLFEEIWHINIVISGFRRWGGNRSILYKSLIDEELLICIDFLKSKINDVQKQKLENLLIYKKEYGEVQSNIENLNKKINSFRILKLIPHFLYHRIKNFIYIKISRKNSGFIQPQINYLDYYSNYLEYQNGVWLKRKISSGIC